MRINNEHGFTMIELLMVIVILAILAATAFPRYYNFIDDAHESVRDAVMGGIKSALDLYAANQMLNDPQGVWLYPDGDDLKDVGGFDQWDVFMREDPGDSWDIDDGGANVVYFHYNVTEGATGTEDVYWIYTYDATTPAIEYTLSDPILGDPPSGVH